MLAFDKKESLKLFKIMAGVLLRNSEGFVSRVISETGRFFLQALILILACFLLHSEVSAQIKTWDGGAGTNNWGDSANWNPDGVPMSSDDVNLTGTNTININVVATTRNLTLNNSSLVLAILSGSSLTVSGNLTLTSGTLNTEGSFPTVSGSTSLTGGTVGYTASSGSQTVAVQKLWESDDQRRRDEDTGRDSRRRRELDGLGGDL